MWIKPQIWVFPLCNYLFHFRGKMKLFSLFLRTYLFVRHCGERELFCTCKPLLFCEGYKWRRCALNWAFSSHTPLHSYLLTYIHTYIDAHKQNPFYKDSLYRTSKHFEAIGLPPDAIGPFLNLHQPVKSERRHWIWWTTSMNCVTCKCLLPISLHY